VSEVWLNGRFVPRDEARVSAFDAGMQHAVGLFETMLGGVREGDPWVFGLEEHLARLKRSVTDLGLSSVLRLGPLAEAVLDTVERAGLERARVRLTLTGGDLNMLAGAGTHDATILIDAQPASAYPAEMFERGVRATIADAKANPFNPTEGHKTLSYWWRLRELQAASGRGASEALVFAVSNHLVGGCVSNAILVKDGGLVTPIARGEEEAVGGKGALPSPVLPGTTRGWVLECAARLDIEVTRRMVSISNVLESDEVMLTNSSWGVLPIAGVEAEPIGKGRAGELTRTLREAWLDAVERCPVGAPD